MNCLSIRNGGHEMEFEEPSAPPCYLAQPPYNPEYVYENIEYLKGLQTWGVYQTESLVRRACCEDYECGDRGRRSLYEGVNCPPVSASSNPSCVQHDARLAGAYA
ncbi:unnamed protein product, partial [Iphiclides podalirius]